MAHGSYHGPLEQVDECCWRIPRDYKRGMRVDGLVYADEALIKRARHDAALEQVANVAFLPGIQTASLAMPDIHWGYGFCIGGVCATDPAAEGVISPGGVGYDINCGVRLIRTTIGEAEARRSLERLVDELYETVPTGVGRTGRFSFDDGELRTLMTEGVAFLEARGLATAADRQCTEALGCLADARADKVSDRALKRGRAQCGTLGAGNHFLEVQVVDEIADEARAAAFGIERGTVCVLIHSGSRGLGYQVCDDTLKVFRDVPERHGIELPDRQLACAPIESPEGRDYLGAMRAAANYAFCNRQLLAWLTREVFERVFGRGWEALGMELVYDVAHNIAKFETHEVEGVTKTVCVHRKGATRAFPPGSAELPEAYRAAGQPVIIPGDMGRASWLLAGAPGSMRRSFGTTCHGAGRAMSRTKAVEHARGRRIDRELLDRGIVARSRSRKGLDEEQPQAYKDVDAVVDVVHRAGLSTRVARLRPMGVIKG